jgi:hypothetical protein
LVIVALYSLRFKKLLNCPVSAYSPEISAECLLVHPEEPEAEARRGGGFFGMFAGGCGRISQDS